MASHRTPMGQLLLATVALRGSPFQDTIVLITERSENGTLGVVINRAVHMPLEEVFSSVKTKDRRPYTFFMGGPARESQLFIVEAGKTAFQGARQFAPGLFWTVLPPNQGIPVGTLFGTPTTRTFLGCSAWAPGQLEEELSGGAWELATAPLGLFSRERESYPHNPDEFKEHYAAHAV